MSQILLVRHGQASFGAEDYDNLSPRGEQQSRRLGRALAARGVTPGLVVAGEMRRHAQTATALLEGAGWELPVEADAGWNEFDHLQVLARHDPEETGARDSEARAFQRWFEDATARWTSGHHDGDYDESFGAFTRRVESALERVAARLPRGGTALVLTSGGPVAWAATSLLGAGTDVWLRLNAVCVNSGVTKAVTGARGTTLVAFNDHSHLLGAALSPDLLTYR